MGSDKQYEVMSVARNFRIFGEFLKYERYGSGHINDTFALYVDQAGIPIRYVVQRINHFVFKDPEGLMANVERVTSHLVDKLKTSGKPDASRRTLTLVPSLDGKSWYRDAEGNYWRVYLFIERAKGYDIMTSPLQAESAARAFGEFQNLLVDIKGGRMVETIPNFHNTPVRFQNLEKAIQSDVKNRAKDMKPEIEFAMKRREFASTLIKEMKSGNIPERITHNDTKLNNVLLDDATGEGICVIDLDTIMPGLALYDFGDMVRSGTNPVSEDVKDLSQVVMNIQIFEALAKGYLSSAGKFLNKHEKAHLVTAGQMMAFECGIRFLTDYLQGDVYFRTNREGQNVDRCRTQFKLLEEMEQNQDKLNEIVQKQG